jgi:hypothetical protein
MVMSMVTAFAALVSLGVADGVAEALLGLAGREVDGLGVALVAAGLGLAVPWGGLVHPVSASPASSPVSRSPAVRRPVGEPVISEQPLCRRGSGDGV